MTTRDFKPGLFYTRPHRWNSSRLAIFCNNGQLEYYTNGEFSGLVMPNSSAYDHSDFVESDRFGKILTNKELSMEYNAVTHLVINSKTNSIKAFESEEAALEWIEEQLDTHPKAKFKIFEPTYSLEPKKTNILDLLTKIVKR
jgi:hypothetical protein